MVYWIRNVSLEQDIRTQELDKKLELVSFPEKI